MKKIFCFCAAAVFALAGCTSGDEGGSGGSGISNPKVEVAQNGQVDLSTLITITPEGAEGELSFRITRQPSYAESGVEAWTPCGDVFSLDGSILKSADIRVPDVLEKSDLLDASIQNHYQRAVTPGQLEAKLTVGGAVVSTVTYDIEQTNKSALPAPTLVWQTTMPTVNGAGAVQDGENWKYSLALSATARVVLYPFSFITVSPIDYSPKNIYMEPLDSSSAIDPGTGYYRHTSSTFYGSGSLTATWSADGAKAGTGELVAFYTEFPSYPESMSAVDQNHAREALYQEAYEAAKATGKNRLIVEVTQTPLQLIGIKANQTAINESGTWEYVTLVRANSAFQAIRFVTAVVSDDGGATTEDVPYLIKGADGVWAPNQRWTDLMNGDVPYMKAQNFVVGEFTGGDTPNAISSASAALANSGKGLNPASNDTTNPAIKDVISDQSNGGVDLGSYSYLGSWGTQFIRTYSTSSVPTLADATAASVPFETGSVAPVGTFTITFAHKKHFLETGFTFRATVTTKSQNDRNDLRYSNTQTYGDTL